MCYFLTLGVPGKSAHFMSSAAPRGFALGLSENKSVLSQLPVDFRTYLLTSGMCSCGLYHRQTKRGTNPSEFLRQKYKQKGWSNARIERAIDQTTKQRQGKGKISFVGLRPDVATIVTDIARQAGRVAVIAHWYGGNTEEETITLSAPRSIADDDLAARSFPFDEDELIWVMGTK